MTLTAVIHRHNSREQPYNGHQHNIGVFFYVGISLYFIRLLSYINIFVYNKPLEYHAILITRHEFSTLAKQVWKSGYLPQGRVVHICGEPLF